MHKKHLKFFIIISAISGVFLAFSYFSNIPSVKADDSMLIKELLFTVEDSQGDAIGVKVMENPQRLPPLLWYNQSVSNPASPSYFAVDNYYALRDDRTVYVGAPNLDASGNEISSYIYIFSYNEGASSESINIFNQLLNNWVFNINIDNPTHKSQLQRDLLRIYDVSEIRNSLSNYYEIKNHYPFLSSGTYDVGKTYTTWPSWQYTLSSELGQSLPVDPINRFNGICSACPDDPTQPDYQCNGTCYNPASQTFSHPFGSHVYEYYTSADPFCAGKTYSLYANLEYKPEETADVVWLGDEDVTISVPDIDGTGNYMYSSPGMGSCGNQIIEECEECECNSGGLACTNGAFTPETTCFDLGLGTGTLQCINCHWFDQFCNKINLGGECNFDAECLSGYCSDGVCCDTACEGLCQYCKNDDGSGIDNGTCHLLPYGKDKRDVCANAGISNPCAIGFCDGFGACLQRPAGDPCGDGICKYCSVDGQCLNTPLGEDYNDACGDNNIANCQAGYCNGYGSCSYYPEGFMCSVCKKCNNQTPPGCIVVPDGTTWGFHSHCIGGNLICDTDWDNCDGDWSNGCETDLLNTFEYCGNCSNDCANTACAEACENGVCVIADEICTNGIDDDCDTLVDWDDDDCFIFLEDTGFITANTVENVFDPDSGDCRNVGGRNWQAKKGSSAATGNCISYGTLSDALEQIDDHIVRAYAHRQPDIEPCFSERTDQLKINNFGFGGVLPSDAVIMGIEVKIWKASGCGADIKDYMVYLVDGNGNIVGDNKFKHPGNWEPACFQIPNKECPQNIMYDIEQFTEYTYGGPNDKWGAGIDTPGQIASSNFGVILQAQIPSWFAKGLITKIAMKIYYHL